MAETAAHRVDHVFPRLPVRQWVVSVPKRLRYFLQREPAALGAVLHIIVRVVEQTLKRHAGENSPTARIGAVSFIHRFGSALNAHVHFHLCVIEAVFAAPGPDGAVQVHALDLPEATLVQAQHAIRRRVLSGFTRRGWLDEDERQYMLGWAGGRGFSLDGSVRIAAEDRAGLERLLRYCARPPFALERLEALGDDRLVYALPKPRPDGQSALVLTPLELIDTLVALIPPPRSPARYRWAALIARIYATWPLLCRACGAERRLVAFITAREPSTAS